MHVSLLPVYSKLADPAQVPADITKRLPQGWQLSQHQLDTYNALLDPNTEVVINTAMTGDGKSLAGLLPLIINKRETLALYPTNELIRDQHTSAANAFALWNTPQQWVNSIDGAKLDHITTDKDYTYRGDAIEHIFNQHNLVLTNPDIFHAILQFFYQHPGRAPDWLAGEIVSSTFRQLTFDEFHTFEVPQVVAVLTALLFLYEQAPKRFKTLFLSATPDDILIPYLKKAGLQTQLIQTSYHYGEAPGAEWRRILHGCDMHVAASKAEEWVDAYLDDVLLPFFRQHRPAAKGAIIVNSVAAAHRLQAKLQPVFAKENLTVQLNTGLTDRATRQASYDADLMVATSTVDVGVDFKINFLVFESSSAGVFLQRLGRLGRHDTVIRHGKEHRFATYVAYALVPEFVQERLFVGHDDKPALLQDGATLSRDNLQQALSEAFHPYTTFKAYVTKWGRFQPAHVISSLYNPKIRDNYAPIYEKLQPRYEQTFGIKISKARGVRLHMKKEGNEAIIEEARSFRGGSPFACGVLTPTPNGSWSPQVYDALWLLANANLDWLDKEAFFRAAGDHTGLAAIRRADPLAYVRLHSYRQERHDVMVLLPRTITEWGEENNHSVQVLKGITIAHMPGVDFLNQLNRHMVQRHFVGFVIPGKHPLEIRRKLALPPLFPLYQYKDIYDHTGCIAFARQALLLDTLRNRIIHTSSTNQAIIT
jgi:CRISPR-associated endonuclease/helicase Cas3